MKTLATLLIGLALISFTTSDQTIPRHNVFFAYNSSELSGSPARVVESVYKKLAAGKKIRFGITGPISNVHNAAEKNRITSERANNIVALLKKISSEDDVFEIVDVTNPYRSKPLDVAATKPFELEVLLTKALAWIEPNFTSIDDYLPIPVQTFLIDPREENRLVGEQGTVINIPANTLSLRNGTVPSQMTVELKEVYGGGTIVNANLHTNSGGKMLETGGTIHLAANTNGSRAKVAYGEQLNLEFPSAENEKAADMQLFKGRVDRNGNFDWIARRRSQEWVSQSHYFIGEKQVTKQVYDSTKTVWMAEEAEYERRRAKRLDELEVQKSSDNQEIALDAYLMSTEQLGWINCDRFYDVEEKTDVIVMVDSTLRPSVRMVFTNIKSVMNGYYNPKTQTVSFSGIPVGEEVKIVGYSIMDDVPYMANKSVTISSNLKTELPMAETTKKQMEAELASLN